MSESVLQRASDTVVPVPAGSPGRSRTAVPAEGARLHGPSAVVLTIGLACSLILCAVILRAVADGNNRALDTQVHQVASALQAAVPAIQQPLVGADRIALIAGAGAFRSFVEPDVEGGQAPFRSISLWKVTKGGRLTLAALARSSANVSFARRTVARTLASLHPSSQLQVTGLFSGTLKGLGFAERASGGARNLIVYAETNLPTPSSQFAGLDFAIFFGRSTSSANLIETSIHIPAKGTLTSAVVAFGSANVTIVTTIVGRPPGVLPNSVPWGIALGGSLLSVVAALTTERHVRRRVLAESVAIDQSARHDEQRGIAQTLQHSLLPADKLEFPGVEMATRYVAGVEHLDVGGDWYDAIRVDDDHLFLTIGDVSGRGLKAATVMSSLRHAIRAYAVQGDDPGTVVRKLDELVDVERDECFATVLCASLDVPRHRVTFASAGHLPPLLVDAEGARLVAMPVNKPAGVAGVEKQRSATLSVLPGTALVFFTDGLVERRERGVDEGLEALRRAVPTPDVAIGSMLTEILDQLVPRGSDDDLALLGLKWEVEDRPETRKVRAAPGAWRKLDGPTKSMSRRFVPDPASVREARRFVEVALPDLHQSELEIVLLLVSELATNAVRHAKTDFEVTVVTDPGAGRIRVGVCDEGSGIPAPRESRELGPDGRGLRLVRELSYEWGVEWSGAGPPKTVWFEHRVGQDGPHVDTRPS
jgi:serine phosphatase RsbU (regulator of sigma subunit)/anti-sigma regulatory factor (Ser/Thr protein kinase)